MSVSSTGWCTRLSASATGGKLQRRSTLRADPFGQGRQLLQRLRDRAAQRAEREALGRADRRGRCPRALKSPPRPARGRDARSAGCRHTSAACRRRSASRPSAAVFRHSRAWRGRRSARRRRSRRWHRPDTARAALRGGGGRWRSTVTSQRHHGSLHGVADLRPRPAVDDLARQMQQEIDQPRRLVAAEQIAQ